jgi:hypothetical protein
VSEPTSGDGRDDFERFAEARHRLEALAAGDGAWRSRLLGAAMLLSDVASDLGRLGPGGDDETIGDLQAALGELGVALENLAGKLADLMSPPAGDD